MNWMTVVIICLVVAMVVGPVMIMQPSKRQRNLAHLRTRAAKMGLRVKMEKIKDDTYAAYEKDWPLTAKERRRIKPWRLEKMPYAHGLHIAQYWHPVSDQPLEGWLREALASRLEQLPNGVQAVEITNGGVRCYWNESGGETVLNALAQWLGELIEIMVPHIRRRPAE